MNPSISFPKSLLFHTVLVLIFQAISSHGSDDPPPLCEPFYCGDKRISYPFRKTNQPEYCGFALDCESKTDQYPLFKVNSQKFHVLDIDPKNRTLKMARLDLSDKVCLANFINTSFESTPFNYTPNNRNVTLFYDCNDQVEDFPDLVNFSCPINNVPRRACFADTPHRAEYLQSFCNISVVVPVMKDGLGGWVGKEIDDVEKVLKDGFEVEWTMINEDKCEVCLADNGSCGHNTTANQFMCFCSDLNSHHQWNCPLTPQWSTKPSRDWEIKAILGVSGGVIAVLCYCITICCYRKTRSCVSNISKKDQDIEAFIRSNGDLTAKRYRFLEVKKITKSFKDKLGQGGYGEVYKGRLQDGRLVAVKLLNLAKGNGEEFINEVASISRTSHVNIVTLLGFCLEGGKRALIYEFMPNGSLEKFVYNDESYQTYPNLEWEQMLRIATGIARGLEYLHRGCNTRILHFDIKPHNILLDEDLCPKISDFGLAKLCSHKQSNISLLDARGTVGYIAPEVFNRNFGGVSSKSDVYSYGMMALEMVGGRKNIKVGVSRTSKIYFPDWIYKQIKVGSDLRLLGDMTSEENGTARKMIIVGLWCIQIAPSDRPSMSKVIEMLEGSLEALQIPPKPTLISPRSPERLPSQPMTESSATLML